VCVTNNLSNTGYSGAYSREVVKTTEFARQSGWCFGLGYIAKVRMTVLLV